MAAVGSERHPDLRQLPQHSALLEGLKGLEGLEAALELAGDGVVPFSLSEQNTLATDCVSSTELRSRATCQ